jgi:ABC-type lipoprotein release transport system permease subunit
MKTNVCLIASLRKPLSSLLFLTLFGLISFAFITKAVEFILIQRETEVLGSYYRSIGVLENITDPQSGGISAGIELIERSPHFAYADQREVVSGVMTDTNNQNFIFCNCIAFTNAFPEEYWPNTHNTDIWFTGELLEKEEVKEWRREHEETIGYLLRFHIDTLFAAYPEDAREGGRIALIFLFEGNAAAIPNIEEMAAGQRYFIRAWDNVGFLGPQFWEYGVRFLIKPLDDHQLWYLHLGENGQIDFNTPEMASIKNRIDILNENLRTLGIIATADMSAIPRMQEASRFYYLTDGRWLNHQDNLGGNKAIVAPECLAKERGLELGDEIELTFRPLQDTYYGHIRDGIDTINWRSYPTYKDSFTIVGLYTQRTGCAYFSYIPTGSLQPGFTSSTQNQFADRADYSFVLNSSRNQDQFTQDFKESLQALGIRLTFLENNGPAYWTAVDTIRRSSSADVLVFGLVMVAALSMGVFLYMMAHKRNYAFLRALGVPVKQANGQLILPLLLLGGLGIAAGGLLAWNYALRQAQDTLSTIPTPAGVFPSAELSPIFLAGLYLAIFLVLAAFAWLGVFILSNKPVFELLQGQSNRAAGGQKRSKTSAINRLIPSLSSSQAGRVEKAGRTSPPVSVKQIEITADRKYTPSSLARYVFHHGLRSSLKSMLTLAIALGFVLASAWIRQTMERSQAEIDLLYDTTVVKADLVPGDPMEVPSGASLSAGNGYVYLTTINNILNSGFVKSSVLEADTNWFRVQAFENQEDYIGPTTVYAYDSPESFHSSLAEPGELIFAPGWDLDLFAKQWTLEDFQKEGVPIIIPSSTLEQLMLEVGERVEVTDRFMNTYPGVIAGQYSGGRLTATNAVKTRWIGPDQILIPLSALVAMDGSLTTFTSAHFSLDPKINRDLSQFVSEMEPVINAPGAGTRELRFILWDEELRVVVNQLDKNMSLLRVLYPVVIAVSVLIGAGLCFLILLQATKEAAIMRVLGTTRTAVRLALISWPFTLSVIGVIIGLGISRLLWTTSDLVAVGALLTGAGLYLAGVLAGSFSGAILVTNKKPMELLQMKE